MKPKHPIPPASSAATRNVMRANRAKNTTPERKLRRFLREAGFSGYRVNWRAAPGTPDVAYPGRRIAVFVHGCFWHHCPKCKPDLPHSHRAFWAAKFRRNRERDKRKRLALQASGWKVYELWECDVRAVAERPPRYLLRALRESEPSLGSG
jgi:DNA mismatch endonuclease (patch repair protein)